MTTRSDRPSWRGRVAELLDDPVGQALLQRDGLTRDEVIGMLAAVVERRRHQAGVAAGCGGL